LIAETKLDLVEIVRSPLALHRSLSPARNCSEGVHIPPFSKRRTKTSRLYVRPSLRLSNSSVTSLKSLLMIEKLVRIKSMYYLKLSTNRFDSTTYDYAAKRFTEKARVGILETSSELLTLIFTKWCLIVKRIVMFWVNFLWFESPY